MPLLLLALLSFFAPPSPSSPPSAAALLAPGAKLEKVVGDLKFSEGPAWHPSGYLLFEDTPRNRIMRLDPGDKVSVFREPSRRSNGLAFDAQGRLVACEGNSTDGGRQVSRTEKDGKVVTLVDKYQGKRLNSPNDLTIDGRGRIYFTDPRYNNRVDLEQDREGVYRIDPDGKLTRIIDSLTRPNGLAVTADGRTLYVADNASPGGVVKLWAYDLDVAGNSKNGRVLHDFVTGRGIDGLTLDTKGRIWTTAGTKEKAGIYVFEPDDKRATAKLAGVIPTPEDPTNVTFGGKDRDILYITTTASLFRIRTAVRGKEGPPGK
jgi:gluconolactonase